MQTTVVADIQEYTEPLIQAISTIYASKLSVHTKLLVMNSNKFINEEMFAGYKSSSNATLQINLKINESDLRLIDQKATRYGLSRSALIKIFAINGELSINIDRDNLRMPII